MRKSFNFRAAIGLGALVLATSCVAQRPSRNGVFNENQYLRKSFLVRPGDSDKPDSGWLLKATITDASAPNVFGDSSIFGLYAGSHNSGELVHFVVTSDKLQMVSNREISTAKTVGQQGAVVNAWPATNVDLKYRINLDGETTNFYEENQELDWQVRQWVKVNLDKNDMSDLAPLGGFYSQNVANCVDSGTESATLVPGSFMVDEKHDYMEWSVQVTLPIKWTTECIEAYGPMGDAAARLGRETETVTLKYSMTRAAEKPTYQPLIIGEKDPILRKYGPITYNSIARDPDTGLLGSNTYVVRFDPQKEIKWYFEKGFPAKYMPYFTSKLPTDLKTCSNYPTGANTCAQDSDCGANGKCVAVTPLQGIQTIEDGTNKLLADSGAPARVSFHQADEPLEDGTAITRTFGDVRWNMLRWLESLDQQAYFAGVESGVVDPRTGEEISSDIVFENFAIKDYYVTRINAYLDAIGASNGNPFSETAWPDQPNDASGKPIACSAATDVGKTVPIVPDTLAHNHNGNSTLFQKMQQYLYKPVNQYGQLGPQDFVMTHADDKGNLDQDFFTAYYTYLPYIVYGDPDANPFVTPEGMSAAGAKASDKLWNLIRKEAELHELEGKLDRGYQPFDPAGPTGEADALAFMKHYKELTLAHRDLRYTKMEMQYMPGVGQPLSHADAADNFAMVAAIQRDARHCVQGADGKIHWETKEEWVQNLIDTYWSQVFWHEFGHALGLEHNFMASVDRPNFPAPPAQNAQNADGTTRYPLYASSVMEYNAAVDRVFWTAGWGPYDQGAISWIYANNLSSTDVGPKPVPMGMSAQGVSGQVSKTVPWNDPNGFDAMGKEKQYLFCNERHTRYTPLCRPGDIGTTPSEITANEIDAYEWQYKWRNFRQYRKIWDNSHYGDGPMNTVTELRRFLSLWSYDMSSSELTQRFQQLGITPPQGAPAAQYYYDQLTSKFNDEMAHAGQISAAFHEAIVQQSAGARPYVTVYDNYFGDVTQQGIFLDKLDAIQGFTSLWPVDNYDPTQAAGAYITSYSSYGTTFYLDQVAIGSIYGTVAEQAIQSMLGGSFDAFYYAKPLAVAQFSYDTHDPNYLGANASPARVEAQEWAGGYRFIRLEDFLNFFRDIAIAHDFYVDTQGGDIIDCTKPDVNACNYDPRTPRGYPTDTYWSDQYNRFVGPDGRRWIWAYLQDRNEWLVADQDRNTATYPTMYNYTTDVVFGKDDGNAGNAFGLSLQLKYMYDYYYQSLGQQ
jgi:hypothetical protein